jgi:hypothetical protein
VLNRKVRKYFDGALEEACRNEGIRMPEDKKFTLDKAPEWFLAVAALIYATGFLVVFTFFARLGIREAGTEFFKVKYVHVGILCLIIPALAAVPAYSFLYMLRRATETEHTGQVAELHVYVPSGILTLNMIATFYIFVMFSPPGYFRTKGHIVPVIFGATLLGLAAVQKISKKGFEVFIGRQADRVSRVSASPESIGSWMRWALCAIVIFFLDRYAFLGIWRDLKEMLTGNMRFTSGGYIFLLFVFVMVYLFWRVSRRCHDLADHKLKIALWATTVPLMFAAFYLCILSFAYSVYAYIPAERGGGSYVDASHVVLTFHGSPAALPSDLIESGLRSKPLLIIEETGNSIYVADPDAAGGPAEWRRGTLPTVIAIRRDDVNSIEYQRPTTTE